MKGRGDPDAFDGSQVVMAYDTHGSTALMMDFMIQTRPLGRRVHSSASSYTFSKIPMSPVLAPSPYCWKI